MQSSDMFNSVKDIFGMFYQPPMPDGRAPVVKPDFSYNGLVSLPVHPTRQNRTLFGSFIQVEVPPAAWAIGYLAGGQHIILGPGLHNLQGVQAGITLLQYVDANQRRILLLPVAGASLDGWQITIQASLVFEICHPLQVAREREPLAVLEQAARAAILAQIENMPHEMLLGNIDTPAQTAADTSANNGNRLRRGLDVIEHGILERLRSRPSLAGLRVVDIAITERKGDERLVNTLQHEALERIQADQSRQIEEARARLEKMKLELQVQTARAGREVSLIQAETQAQLSSVEQQERLMEARAEAEIREIAQVQEAREAERRRIAEEWRTAKELELKSMEYQHSQTIAIINGTTQVTSEAARNGTLGGIQGCSGNLQPEEGDNAVSSGIQVLGSFREKITPPTTYFLPKPAQSSDSSSKTDRTYDESVRLERLRHADHELIIRRGELAGARICFSQEANPRLQNVIIRFSCPSGYPHLTPQVLIERDGVEIPFTIIGWDPHLYLVDLTSEIMMHLVSE